MDKLTERLRRFVRSRVANRYDAEDVIQDAYLRVLRYSAENVVENEERLLFCAARNLALDTRRRVKVRERSIAECMVLFAEVSRSSDEVVDAQQRLVRVKAAIARLPVRRREVFLMHRIDCMSYSEIARSVGISISAVEKHIARACYLVLR